VYPRVLTQARIAREVPAMTASASHAWSRPVIITVEQQLMSTEVS